MELKDLLVTPVWLMIIYSVAYLVRSRCSDPVTRKYFIPALTVRILGAISIGLIYQYYYDGGDTFNFFTHGSKYIWQSWKDSPIKAIKLIFATGEHYADTFQYSNQIWYYRDLQSYFVVRVVALLDLLTFHTYTATACLFATISFTALWSMFQAFYKLYPQIHRSLAISILFVPSVFFWGAGIMKDTLTLAAICFIIVGMVKYIYSNQISVGYIILMGISFFTLYSIRIYILLCLIPALMLWYFLERTQTIRSALMRWLITPVVVIFALSLSYVALDQISKEHNRYSFDKLAYTAETTAKWINYVSNVEQGSGYVLGDFDYSMVGIIKKFPLALNVTLFRPYIWEVQNPMMLLAAVESFLILMITIYVLIKARLNLFTIPTTSPFVTFLIVFSISFAFAVGFSTYNFGSLVRYKIPLIPLYLSALSILYFLSNEKRRSISLLSPANSTLLKIKSKSKHDVSVQKTDPMKKQ